jgi:hypothetical protein
MTNPHSLNYWKNNKIEKELGPKLNLNQKGSLNSNVFCLEQSSFKNVTGAKSVPVRFLYQFFYLKLSERILCSSQDPKTIIEPAKVKERKFSANRKKTARKRIMY